MCVPSLSGPTVSGELQPVNGSPGLASSRHWNVEPVSELENVNVGEATLLGFVGVESSVVFGGVESST